MRRTAPSQYEYTYFIRMGDDGPIKIGRSHDPWDRLNGLQTANPYRLSLMLVIRGGYWEGVLHERLEHLALMGEWFRPDPTLVAFVERLAGRASRRLARTMATEAGSGRRKPRNRNMPPRPRLDEISHEFLTADERGQARVGYWQCLAPLARPEDLASCELPSPSPYHRNFTPEAREHHGSVPLG